MEKIDNDELNCQKEKGITKNFEPEGIIFYIVSLIGFAIPY